MRISESFLASVRSCLFSFGSSFGWGWSCWEGFGGWSEVAINYDDDGLRAVKCIPGNEDGVEGRQRHGWIHRRMTKG